MRHSGARQTEMPHLCTSKQTEVPHSCTRQTEMLHSCTSKTCAFINSYSTVLFELMGKRFYPLCAPYYAPPYYAPPYFAHPYYELHTLRPHTMRPHTLRPIVCAPILALLYQGLYIISARGLLSGICDPHSSRTPSRSLG